MPKRYLTDDNFDHQKNARKRVLDSERHRRVGGEPASELPRPTGIGTPRAGWKHAAEYLTLLQTITLEVAAAEDLFSALELVLRRVCEKTGWALGQAWLPRADGSALICGPAWISDESSLGPFGIVSQGCPLTPDVGLPGRVWASRKPAWIRDVTLDANFPRAQVARKIGLKAALGIPIMRNNEVVAVVEFFLREPRNKDDRLVTLITAVAAHLGLVIERKQAEDRNRQTLHELTERVKELTLLHQAARILGDDERPIADLLGDLIAIIPGGWQHLEVAAARVMLGAVAFATPNFIESAWRQRAPFTTADGAQGSLEVAYIEERPTECEGPFLADERKLIDSLARMIGSALRRRAAWDELNRVNEELEQSIAARTAALEAKTRELEAFSYSVAHDLKAPLRGIDGYTRLLLEDHREGVNDEGRTFLHNVRESTERMSQLIDDLLRYSQLERRAFARTSIDLTAFIDALVHEKRAELKQRNIELTTRVTALFLLADADGLAQALRNYLDNAIKFTRGVAAPRIHIGAAETATGCCISVNDNGGGFDMKYHDRMFEMFQRLHRVEDYPGTGIGLAVARKAAERMGGRVWAEGAVGAGATFYIEIPCGARG
jgi:signal transduction histidine kinase